MWGTSFHTATLSPDSYYNCYYDKENKFRAVHLFYDKSIFGPIQAYRASTYKNQGPAVLH